MKASPINKEYENRKQAAKALIAAGGCSAIKFWSNTDAVRLCPDEHKKDVKFELLEGMVYTSEWIEAAKKAVELINKGLAMLGEESTLSMPGGEEMYRFVRCSERLPRFPFVGEMLGLREVGNPLTFVSSNFSFDHVKNTVWFNKVEHTHDQVEWLQRIPSLDRQREPEPEVDNTIGTFTFDHENETEAYQQNPNFGKPKAAAPSDNSVVPRQIMEWIKTEFNKPENAQYNWDQYQEGAIAMYQHLLGIREGYDEHDEDSVRWHLAIKDVKIEGMEKTIASITAERDALRKALEEEKEDRKRLELAWHAAGRKETSIARSLDKLADVTAERDEYRKALEVIFSYDSVSGKACTNAALWAKSALDKYPSPTNTEQNG